MRCGGAGRSTKTAPVQRADAGGALSELHARRDDRGQEHRAAGGSARQGRLDRLAGQRHRSDRVPPAAGRRPRPDRDIRRQALSASTRRSMPSRTARSTRSSGAAACRRRRVLDLASTVGHHGEAPAERRRASGAAGDVRAVALLPAGDAERFLSGPARRTSASSASTTCSSSTSAWSDELAYDLTRMLFDKQAELAAIHPEARHLAPRRGDRRLAGAVPSGRDPLLPGTWCVEAVAPRPAPHLTTLASRIADTPADAARSGGLGTVLAIGLVVLRALLGRRDRAAARLSRHLPARHPGPQLPLLSRPAQRDRERASPRSTGLLIGLAVRGAAWPLLDFDNFIYRAADPHGRSTSRWASSRSSLVLEATRRTTGWILPVTAALLPRLHLLRAAARSRRASGLIAHRGYDPPRIVGTLYMTLEGIFGVPLEVAATYIILFSIYGAILTASGAGKFFLDWSMAAVGRSGGGAGTGPRRHRRRAAARHGLGERRGQHRHARIGRVAAAEARAATRRRWAARSSRPPASAPSSVRPRSAPRRSSSRSSCTSPTCR